MGPATNCGKSEAKRKNLSGVATGHRESVVAGVQDIWAPILLFSDGH